MNLSHKKFILVLLIAVALGMVGYQQKETIEKAKKKIDKAIENTAAASYLAHKPLDNGPDVTGYFRNDNAITEKVKTDIMSATLLKTSHINVTTTNGVVSLSGVVESEQSVDKASEIARNVKHVRSVKNDLAVKAQR